LKFRAIAKKTEKKILGGYFFCRTLYIHHAHTTHKAHVLREYCYDYNCSPSTESCSTSNNACASEMTCIVSSGALNSTHSLTINEYAR